MAVPKSAVTAGTAPATELVADAEDLIARQYADRPHLRPIFDAVIAALPALPGPVTVQARGTLVSLSRRAARSRC